MKNNTLLQSIVKQQCPSCRSERMFNAPAYSMKFGSMHEKCPNCSQSLEPEPGFYTGAMYVSYAFQVAIVVSVIVATRVLNFEGAVSWYVGWIGGINLVLFPLIYRLSRSVWIHIFVPFKNRVGMRTEIDT